MAGRKPTQYVIYYKNDDNHGLWTSFSNRNRQFFRKDELKELMQEIVASGLAQKENIKVFPLGPAVKFSITEYVEVELK